MSKYFLPCIGGPCDGQAMASDHPQFQVAEKPKIGRRLLGSQIAVQNETLKVIRYELRAVNRDKTDSRTRVDFWLCMNEPEPPLEEILYKLRGW